MGFIARQTDQGLPVYNDNVDHFVYNGGRELVRVGADGETMPDWAVDAPYYRAKIEGLFMRFYRMNSGGANGPVYWKAQDKDGTLYFFGGTDEGVDEDALICDTSTSASCDRVFRWNLVLVRDVHGNEVRYVYTQHQGQSYLTDVLYNNHPTSSRW